MPTKQPLRFEQATKRAERYVADADKLSQLLQRATRKAERDYEFMLAQWESLQTLLRLTHAWLNGKYGAPVKFIAVVVAAIIYFVEPFDLIPDTIPVLGLVDDSAVITSVMKSKTREISRFVNWAKA
jgi:uncharacterized membrane protein YkvA (DUF1232 family)